MNGLIADLDEYFCEKYANYDKICGLKGYVMPVRQTTRTDEFGRTVAYTLPPEHMRLSLQLKREELLAQLKTELLDKSFSFSFQPYNFFQFINQRFTRTSFYKHLEYVLYKHNLTAKEVGTRLKIDEKIWRKIYKGYFEPSKNLIFSLALNEHLTFGETQSLLYTCGVDFDYTQEKDVVISYLLDCGVYNEDMIRQALDEYKITNLYI